MFRSSKDDDQVLVVFMGSRNGNTDAGSEVANAFLGVLAVAIVLMVFVGLVNDSERRRLQDWQAQPNPSQVHPLPATYYSTY